MYICRDCGAKYAQKVEYCDCGNNTFDAVDESPQPVKKSDKPQRLSLTLEQKGELISRLFLILCIIMSVIVWLVPVKIDQSELNTQSSKEQKVNAIANIPQIDKFWDNTPVKVDKKVEQEETFVINENNPIPLNVVPDYAKPKFVEQKKTTPQQVKQEASQTKKISSTPKLLNTSSSQAATPKTQNQNVKNQTTKQNTSKQAETKSATKQNNPPSPKLYEPVTQKFDKTEPKTEPQKPAYNPNSPEMLQYKGSLRAAMFSKFAVGSIQGNGSCSVKFSVDTSGKLINRAFVKQSNNKSLNDAVYYMLMSVPKFSPPPLGYNGETIQMNFKIENGGYEISIY